MLSVLRHVYSSSSGNNVQSFHKLLNPGPTRLTLHMNGRGYKDLPGSRGRHFDRTFPPRRMQHRPALALLCLAFALALATGHGPGPPTSIHQLRLRLVRTNMKEARSSLRLVLSMERQLRRAVVGLTGTNTSSGQMGRTDRQDGQDGQGGRTARDSPPQEERQQWGRAVARRLRGGRKSLPFGSWAGK
jgi:hypothetical protein